VLGVAWTYRLGRELVSPRVGLYAAALVGASAFYANHLHEIRVYAFPALLAALVVTLYLHIMNPRRKPGVWAWLGLTLGAAGMLYAHYFAALPLVPLGLYHLWAGLRRFVTPPPVPLPNALRRGRPQTSSPELGGRVAVGAQHAAPLQPAFWRRWWGVVVAMLVAGALYLPWGSVLLVALGKAAEHDRIHREALTTLDIVRETAYLFSNGVPLLFAALVALALVALVLRQRGAGRLLFFAAGTVGALLLAAALTQMVSGGRSRYLIGLWPFLALVGALGMTQLDRVLMRGRGSHRPYSAVLLLAWLVIGVAATLDGGVLARVDGTRELFRLRDVAEGLRRYAAPGDTVVNYLPDDIEIWEMGTIGQYYFDGMGIGYRLLEHKGDDDDERDQRRDVIGSLAEAPRVWVAYMPAARPSELDEFEEALDENYDLCAAQPNRAVELRLYVRPPAACPP
jgi:hypothetical protein